MQKHHGTTSFKALATALKLKNNINSTIKKTNNYIISLSLHTAQTTVLTIKHYKEKLALIWAERQFILSTCYVSHTLTFITHFTYFLNRKRASVTSFPASDKVWSLSDTINPNFFVAFRAFCVNLKLTCYVPSNTEVDSQLPALTAVKKSALRHWSQ